MFQVGAFAATGIIGRETQETLSAIIHKLVRIAFHAEKGDEKAVNQLAVLHKVAHPFSYDLPSPVIKSLADSYHTSPHLARAWDVRDLMLDLSYIVEPTNFDRSILEGSVRLTTHNLHTKDRKLHAMAARHIKRGTTLLSLATSIYIEQLDQEGIKLDPRQIRLDFEKLKEWEAINLKDEPSHHWMRLWERAGEYPGATIPPIPIYSTVGSVYGDGGIKIGKSYPRIKKRKSYPRIKIANDYHRIKISGNCHRPGLRDAGKC